MRTIAIAAGLLLLALPSQGLAEAPAPIPGGEARPQPLAGVPLDLRCNALLSPRHPLLDRQSGQDLHDLARTDGEEVDLAKWLDDYLCDLVWQELARSGAHRSPRR